MAHFIPAAFQVLQQVRRIDIRPKGGHRVGQVLDRLGHLIDANRCHDHQEAEHRQAEDANLEGRPDLSIDIFAQLAQLQVAFVKHAHELRLDLRSDRVNLPGADLRCQGRL